MNIVGSETQTQKAPSHLAAPVLVLNKGYTPIHIKSVADAICDVVSEVCEVLQHNKTLLNGQPNPYYYNLYSWEKWAALPLTSKFDKNGVERWYVNLGHEDGVEAFVEAPRVVRGARGHVMAAPFVTRHLEYDEVPELEIRKTRKNIWLRDSCKCQYCGKKVSLKDMTVDHILPQSRGGKKTWTNECTCCFDCNIQKRDRTPQEAGMHLIGWPVQTPKGIVMEYTPTKPRWYPLFSKFAFQLPSEWDEFLPESAKVRPPGVMVG